MNKQKLTLTIGIPAYNEEENIKKLLDNLLRQKSKNFDLKEIIVYSDFSIDKTDHIVNAMSKKNSIIKLISGKMRLGQASVQNKIIENTDTDILVLINADVVPSCKDLIQDIVTVFQNDDNVGLVSTRVIPAEPNNLFDSIVSFGHDTKNRIYESILNTNPIYLCHGRCRGMKRSFYKKLNFPGVVAEDAYSYLRCKELKFDFKFSNKSGVIFRSPNNLSDHYKQSYRFFLSVEELSKKFKTINVYKEYKIPKANLIKHSVKALITDPFLSIMYGFVLLIIRLYSYLPIKNTQSLAWSPSTSSKKI